MAHGTPSSVDEMPDYLRLVRGGRPPSPELVAPPPAPPPPPLRYAADQPDPSQVRSAFGEVRRLYVNGGPGALVRASADCARRLQADPSRLDHCLAFDIYAADVLPPSPEPTGDAAWFDDSDTRAIALARAALPGWIDAANRVAQVRALTTAVLPRPAPARVASAERRRHAAGARIAQESRRRASPSRHRASAVEHEPPAPPVPPPSGPDLSKIVPPI
jgi:hypothetical protein